MDKKYCDKCEKEIKDTYYSISVYKYNSAGKEAEELGSDYCPKCYKEIKLV